MGECFGRHPATGLALQVVVANSGGGPQAFLNITLLQDLPFALSVMRPDAGVAVGLQFHA